MLIDEYRPKLLCGEIDVDNISPNGEVFFIDEGHKYFSKEDVIDGAIVEYDSSAYRFKSPTGILENFKEGFDSDYQAKKYVIKHDLDITWKELKQQWEDKGTAASEEGTLLHGYGESLLNKWGMPAPGTIKDKFVEELIAELLQEYLLVKTELLVYSKVLRIAGQVDLLMKHRETGELSLMDYKFLKEPLAKKSFYNPRTKKYKMMFGPFKRLFDTKRFHYSIQMAIYIYLMGSVGKRVTSSTLLVVTPGGYERVSGWPIKIWCDKEGYIQASYIDPRWGKPFNSTKDAYYMRNRVKFY